MPTLWFDHALLPTGWTRAVRVETAEGRIAQLEPGAVPLPGDERHAIVIPGLANVHSHAFQRGMAGLAERRGPPNDDFWTWREIMYRFLDRLTPEHVRAIASLAYVEMLETGFTRVGEFHYLHHDCAGNFYADRAAMAEAIAAAARETNIALTLLPVFYAHGNFGGAPPVAGQRRFLNDVANFAKLFADCGRLIADLPDANLGVAPHSLRAVTPEELVQIVSLAGNGPIHIHAAEQTKEVDDCIAWSGTRPVEWLLEHVPVNEFWTLVHATHMTRNEASRLANCGAVAGICAVTEANLGDGVFRARDFLPAGGRFAIGTDSNVHVDAAEELRSIEYAQRLTCRARNLWPSAAGVSTGRALFDGALAGGARSLGQHAPGLEIGANADLVSFDQEGPMLVGRLDDYILDGWIFAGARPDCVWRRGVKCVSEGRHIARPRVEAEYRRAMRQLLSNG